MTTQTIKMKIRDESELFSEFDPDSKLLSEDVLNYLTRSFRNVHRFEWDKIALHIISETPMDKENVKQKLRDYFEQEITLVKRTRWQYLIKALSLGVLGVIVLSIWYFLSADKEGVNLEILSIIGWVAIWEATSLIIMGQHELRQLKRDFNLMKKAEIIITDPNS